MMRLRIKVLLLSIVFFNNFHAIFGQDKNEQRLDGIVGTGIHFNIDPRYPQLKNPVYFSELNYARTTFQKKYWHYVQHYPELGLSIIFNTNAEKNVFGNAVAIIPSFGMRLNNNENFRLYCRLGLGLGYVQHWYHRFENPTNVVIGTPINIAANGKFFAEIPFKGKHHLLFGLNALHYSNAKIQLPNLGINVIGLFLGYRYIVPDANLQQNKAELFARKSDSISNSYFVQCRTGLGFTNIIKQGGGLYPVTTFAAAFGRTYNQRRGKIYVGGEMHNNSAIKAFDKLSETEDNPKKWNRIAVFAGHEFIFSRIGFVLQCGVNVRRELLSRSVIYNKLGYNFYWKDNNLKNRWNAYLGLYVQAAAGEAEFPEISLGLQF